MCRGNLAERWQSIADISRHLHITGAFNLNLQTSNGDHDKCIAEWGFRTSVT